jgi:hypothetical protein
MGQQIALVGHQPLVGFPAAIQHTVHVEEEH